VQFLKTITQGLGFDKRFEQSEVSEEEAYPAKGAHRKVSAFGFRHFVWMDP
jgi:hypothetical protein